jgi:hypothetical protein
LEEEEEEEEEEEMQILRLCGRGGVQRLCDLGVWGNGRNSALWDCMKKIGKRIPLSIRSFAVCVAIEITFWNKRTWVFPMSVTCRAARPQPAEKQQFKRS